MLGQVTPPETLATRRVAVLAHMGRREAVVTAARLIEKLAAAGMVAVVPAADVAVLTERLTDTAVVGFTAEQFAEHTDDVELMLVLGGDGTILRGAALVITSDIPLLGVNLGHVGFLAEAESSEIDSIVEHVVNRTYTVEERFTIDVTLREQNKIIWSSFAVNEVSIEKAARERMLEIAVAVDDWPLSRWACDGMLVATPTGSTAYAFSAGGPVLWPELDALLLVPLSAHALFSRPLVLGPTSVITVQLIHASRTHGVVWCDGSRSIELQEGMEIEVGRGEHRLRLARLSQSPFSNRLVHKFQLPVDGWRGSAERRMRHRAGTELASPRRPGGQDW
ncbi:MAG: NAD kinase [Microlunatus sp.]|nr:NAD kinase [Microlunatus sp.]MDN5770323.1 NAD kinase [Microlunatus sp.]MDN5803229.1 NAD kinase [Microlunatus sp.]